MTEITTAAVPGQRRPHDLADDAARLLVDAFVTWFSTSPAARFVEHAGVVRMTTGVPAPPFNGVMTADGRPSAAEVLAAVDEFAAGRMPWNVQLRPGYPAELDDALAARGLVVTGEIPLMVLTDASRLPPSGDLRLRPVASYDDLTDAMSLLEAGFGMPPEITRRHFPVTALVGNGGTTWIARDAGEDVSTAYGVVQRSGGVGIFNVATPEQHRGKGYGGVVTAHAVRTGLATGGTWCYLQSSPMGLPVYERLGFVTVELWRQWMPKAQPGEG